MKYLYLILLTICAAAAAIDEAPGWPVALGEYDGVFIASPVAEDMDCDGDLEIIIAGPDNMLRVFNYDGTDFAGFPLALSGDVRTPVAVGRITDNWNQMAVLTGGGDLYAIAPNGTILPSFPVSLGDSAGPAGPVLWDFDGDNGAEIVVHVGENLHVIEQDGSEMTGFPVAVASEYGPGASPAVGDFTGDGTAEIVAVGYNAIYAFEHSGISLIGFPVEVADSEAFSYSAPVLVDFDGDDTLEICCGYHSFGGTNRGYIGVWDYSGNVPDGWPIGTADYGSWVYGSCAAGESDNDGLPEIAAASRNGRGYLLNEDATSPDPWSISLGIGEMESGPLLLDFDGDGGPDVLFLGNNSDGTITCLNAFGTVIDSFPFDGDTSFGLSTPFAYDMEKDGDIEICALDRAGNLHLFVYPGEGRRYAKPWAVGRHDPLRTGWLHPTPPDTVVATVSGDSVIISWSAVSSWDFAHYSIYATADEDDSSGGILLIEEIFDTFAVVAEDTVEMFYFVTANTRQIEGERSMIAAIDTTTSISEKRLPDDMDISIRPNPFNSAVRITIENGNLFGTNSRMEIYDISGRLVESVTGDAPGGFIWEPDKTVASGLYLARVIYGEKEYTRRLVLIR